MGAEGSAPRIAHAEPRGHLAPHSTSTEQKHKSELQLRTCGAETTSQRGNSEKGLGREKAREPVVGGKYREVRP